MIKKLLMLLIIATPVVMRAQLKTCNDTSSEYSLLPPPTAGSSADSDDSSDNQNKQLLRRITSAPVGNLEVMPHCGDDADPKDPTTWEKHTTLPPLFVLTPITHQTSPTTKQKLPIISTGSKLWGKCEHGSWAVPLSKIVAGSETLSRATDGSCTTLAYIPEMGALDDGSSTQTTYQCGDTDPPVCCPDGQYCCTQGFRAACSSASEKSFYHCTAIDTDTDTEC